MLHVYVRYSEHNLHTFRDAFILHKL